MISKITYFTNMQEGLFEKLSHGRTRGNYAFFLSIFPSVLYLVGLYSYKIKVI